MISGVEDDDKIVDSINEPGELQAKFIGLGVRDGKVKVEVVQSIVADGGVAILMGGTNSFEHFLFNKMQQSCAVPNGNYKKLSRTRTCVEHESNMSQTCVEHVLNMS